MVVPTSPQRINKCVGPPPAPRQIILEPPQLMAVPRIQSISNDCPFKKRPKVRIAIKKLLDYENQCVIYDKQMNAVNQLRSELEICRSIEQDMVSSRTFNQNIIMKLKASIERSPSTFGQFTANVDMLNAVCSETQSKIVISRDLYKSLQEKVSHAETKLTELNNLKDIDFGVINID